MEIALPEDHPREVCLEVSTSSGSLPPPFARHRRLTLWGNGQLDLLEVQGYLPSYSRTNESGEWIDDLQLWSRHPGLAPQIRHLEVRAGRITLIDTAPLNSLTLAWQEQTASLSAGKARLQRWRPAGAAAAACLRAVWEAGWPILPEQIGSPAPGSRCDSLQFACRLAGKFYRRDINCYSYGAQPALRSQFERLRDTVGRELENLCSASASRDTRT